MRTKKSLTIIVIGVVLILTLLNLSSCKKDEDAKPVPSINGFVPETGPAGTSVAITGENFSERASDNIVAIGSTVLTVTAASPTQINITIPAGATTGKFSVTSNEVKVSAAKDFVVVLPPTIASFAPAAGPVGTSVVITGTNFSTIITNNVVKFNGTPATITAATTTQLTVTAPANATTGAITVATEGLSVTSTSNFTILVPPTITSFEPASGLIGATIVITGTNFIATTSGNTVKFGTVEATVTAATTTQLTVTVPAGAVSGKVTVTTQGMTVTSANNFTVNEVFPPTIVSFTPASGLVGATVTITGTRFSTVLNENTVKFGSVTATVSAATATQLTVTVPASAVSEKISVSTTSGTAISSNSFVVLVLPTITSFNPGQGRVGSTVTVTGTNFGATIANNTVKLNGVTATITAASATSLTFTVPSGAATGQISVTTAAGTTASSSDFIVICPDLELQALNISNVGGSALGFSYTLKNVGTATALAADFKLYVYVSDDNSYSDNDLFVGTVDVADVPLTAGNGVSSGGSVNNAVFNDLSTMKYIAVVVRGVNGANLTHNECTETNNTLVKVMAVDVIRDGLIALYPFSGSGVELISNTAARTMTLGQSTSPTLGNDRFGSPQHALNFAVGQEALAAAPILPLQPWTISYWMNYSTLQGNTGAISSMANTKGLFAYIVQKGTSYAFHVAGDDGPDAGGTYILSDPTITEGYLTATGTGWFMVTMTYDGAVFKIYINDTQVQFKAVTATTVVGPQLNFGRSFGYDYTGQLDDLLIYNRALSVFEIFNLKKQTITRY